MTTRIVELSNIISEKTRIVDAYFTKNGLPTPSFDVSGPSRIQIPSHEKEAFDAHLAVLDATTELNLLLNGPAAVIMNISTMDSLSLHAIYRFRIPQALPMNTQMSLEDLSAATGLNVVDLGRLLRQAMCSGIFCEPKAGFVSHTAASKLLVDNKVIFDFVGLITEEKFPASAKVVDALIKYKGDHAPGRTGFSFSENTEMGLYEFMDANPQRGRRWAGAMNAFAAMLSLEPLLAGYDWGSFGRATMVDVGGAWGPVSVAVANRFPDLTFIVQDLPTVVAEGPENIPKELHERIQFMAYDIILDSQPVRDADIYFFRAVLHNWPDKYCVRILRNHIPALKPGARLVIYESCLHEPNTLPPTHEKRRRDMDLSMLTYFGARERTVADWEEIFKEADPRFHLRSAKVPPNDNSHVFDVEWKG